MCIYDEGQVVLYSHEYRIFQSVDNKVIWIIIIRVVNSIIQFKQSFFIILEKQSEDCVLVHPINQWPPKGPKKVFVFADYQIV